MIQPKRMSAEQISEVTARHEFFRVGDVDAVWCIRLLGHIAALDQELATLRASVVDALSSAGPEVAEDERSA